MEQTAYRSGKDELYAYVGGEGPAILYYHPLTMTYEAAVQMLGRLYDSHTIVTPELRGHGASVCVHAECHTWEQYVDDVGTLMDRLGLDGVVIGGSSFGSAIALAAALRWPRRFRAILLLGPVLATDPETVFADSPPDRRDELVATFTEQGAEAAVDFYVDVQKYSGALARRVRRGLRRFWSEHDPTSFARVLLGPPTEGMMSGSPFRGLRPPFTHLDELKVLEMPVLVVPHEAYPSELSEPYMRVLPNATYVANAGASVEDTIRGFLGEVG